MNAFDREWRAWIAAARNSRGAEPPPSTTTVERLARAGMAARARPRAASDELRARPQGASTSAIPWARAAGLHLAASIALVFALAAADATPDVARSARAAADWFAALAPSRCVPTAPDLAALGLPRLSNASPARTFEWISRNLASDAGKALFP